MHTLCIFLGQDDFPGGATGKNVTTLGLLKRRHKGLPRDQFKRELGCLCPEAQRAAKDCAIWRVAGQREEEVQGKAAVKGERDNFPPFELCGSMAIFAFLLYRQFWRRLWSFCRRWQTERQGANTCIFNKQAARKFPQFLHKSVMCEGKRMYPRLA